MSISASRKTQLCVCHIPNHFYSHAKTTKKVIRQGHHDKSMSVCLVERKSPVCTHVCVCVFTGQSEVQAVARKHILWQHAVLLSDTTQEHDVQYSGCRKSLRFEITTSTTDPPPLCDSFPSEWECPSSLLSLSLSLLAVFTLKPLRKRLGVQGQQEHCLFLKLCVRKRVCVLLFSVSHTAGSSSQCGKPAAGCDRNC